MRPPHLADLLDVDPPRLGRGAVPWRDARLHRVLGGPALTPAEVTRPLRTLPDLLRPGLDLVFVGINPGEASARRRHYYAHPGNRFWKALSASPLVEEDLGPDDDRALPSRYGIGFTDVVKRVVTDSSEVTDAELRAALPAFRARVAYARPRIVCLTTTRGFHVCFPAVRAASEWGRQPVAIGEAEVWVMPSTSGRAVAHRAHVHRVLEQLAERLTALRENIEP